MSVWLPSAPCTPQACAAPARSGTAVPRAVLRLLAFLTVLATGIALIPVVARCAPARRDRLVRRWCRMLVRAMGIRLRVTGTAVPDGGVLLVANHISWLDIPLLAAVRPARMLAKTEIRAWPVAGALVALGGSLFIDRDRLRALPGTVATIASALRRGAAVAAFPEGSTWCGRAQGPFRRAVFQAALDAGVPVQPVRLAYRTDGGVPSTAPAFVGEDSLGASLWRVATARGLVADVEVRPVLAAGAVAHRRELTAAAEMSVTGVRAPHPAPYRIPAPAARRPRLRPLRGPGRTPTAVH
ncbi:lysophospholipid acyltransferase family protein [Streptomyces sp. NPDC091292]|uniref:lysophospholipid acyltransferase family protein n=1 Tax=Streptomyces sp. NPDC091292 TaxID=3365991 RepID=UPI00380A971C